MVATMAATSAEAALERMVHAYPTAQQEQARQTLADALRGVMNDAMTARLLAPQLINLTLWTVVSYVVALKIFRWQ